MKIERAAAIPLAVHDPYFSIWSGADRLTDADPIHWSGVRQQMRGYLNIAGKRYRFMGADPLAQPMEQVSVSVSATATEYVFEAPEGRLTVRFTSPTIAGDLLLLSRPCTYIDLTLEKTSDAKASVELTVSRDLAAKTDAKLIGLSAPAKGGMKFSYAMMGRASQRPLGDSADNSTIDWGYVYLASQDEDVLTAFDAGAGQLVFKEEMRKKKAKASLILACDDLLSINYFGEWRKGYWTKEYADILAAIAAAFSDREQTLKKAAQLDKKIEKEAKQLGGEDYAFLCALSYRHTLAAHKLITDENGEVVFLSRENDSNSCIGTVDVSYPSVPLLLLENPELVKGLLRPVFRFADCPVWEFDFAPHDVGRYPYAWGQVYGLNDDPAKHDGSHGNIFPPFYQYPAGFDIFAHRYQMPVEESGNMAIMTAAVCLAAKDVSFALPYMDTLKTWTNYLLEYGEDPGEQLCTDDFAGHLARNVNLSAKAIAGIACYARILRRLGRAEEAGSWEARARKMANSWLRRAKTGEGTALTFDGDGWSMKYNLVWDRVLGLGLLPQEFYDEETRSYLPRMNGFGLPLDSRADYTKSDWLVWSASMAQEKEVFCQIIAPLARYLRTTPTRVPFSDWYDTKTARFVAFIGRSVQGGVYMPMLCR